MNSNKILCEKSKVKFEMEQIKMKDMEEGIYLRFKKIDGNTALFRDFTRNIISVLN